MKMTITIALTFMVLVLSSSAVAAQGNEIRHLPPVAPADVPPFQHPADGRAALVSQGGATFDEALLKYLALGNREIRTMIGNEFMLGIRAGEALPDLATRIASAAYRVGSSDRMQASMAMDVVDQGRVLARDGKLPGYFEQQAADICAEAAVAVGQSDPGYIDALMNVAMSKVTNSGLMRDGDVLNRAFTAAVQSPAIDPIHMQNVIAAAQANGFSGVTMVAGQWDAVDGQSSSYATGSGDPVSFSLSARQMMSSVPYTPGRPKNLSEN